jgi:hypothetical protein
MTANVGFGFGGNSTGFCSNITSIGVGWSENGGEYAYGAGLTYSRAGIDFNLGMSYTHSFTRNTVPMIGGHSTAGRHIGPEGIMEYDPKEIIGHITYKNSGPFTKYLNWMSNHFEISGGYEVSYGFQLGGGFKNGMAAHVNLWSTVRSDLNLSNKPSNIYGDKYVFGEKVNKGVGGALYGGIDYNSQTYKGQNTRTVSYGVFGFGATLDYGQNGNLNNWFVGFDPSFRGQFGVGIDLNFRIGFSK